MYHNKYRAAKKFKLEYDAEEGYYVADEFTGTAKRPLRRDWDDYRDGRKLYELHANPNARYLQSRIGDKWDDVWSDICRVNSNKTFKGQWHRKTVEWNVEKHVKIVDGIPCRSTDARYGRSEITGLYIHPVSGILCDAGPWKRPKYSYPKTKWKFDDGAVFSKEKHTYQRRIAPGVFEDVTSEVWMKTVKEKYMGEESYRVNEFGPHWEYNYKAGKSELVDGWHSAIKYRTVEMTRNKHVTASKKDIRKYNLNKEK